MIKKDSMIDSFSFGRGHYACPLDNPNNPIPYCQRSLPYVKDPSAYHQYKFKDDLSNLKKWVENSDPQTREDIEDFVLDNGISYDDLVNRSIITSAFEEPGGGILYMFAIPLQLLRKSGILEEITVADKYKLVEKL